MEHTVPLHLHPAVFKVTGPKRTDAAQSSGCAYVSVRQPLSAESTGRLPQSLIYGLYDFSPDVFVMETR
jgi:hypothetical protein